MRWPSNSGGWLLSGCMRGSAIILPHAVSRTVLGRPFDPAVDHRLAVLGLHRALEVGDLAVGDVVTPAVEHAGGAVLAEQLRHLAPPSRGTPPCWRPAPASAWRRHSPACSPAPSSIEQRRSRRRSCAGRRTAGPCPCPVMRGSFIIFWFAASRTAFDGYSSQVKTTTSSDFACTAPLKSVTLPSGTSSPQVWTMRVTPSPLKRGSTASGCGDRRPCWPPARRRRSPRCRSCATPVLTDIG